MNLTPHSNPARIKIKVGEGAAQSSSTGERNQRSTKEILFRPSVMKESNLAMYFPLDEPENATTVQDWGPHGLVGTGSVVTHHAIPVGSVQLSISSRCWHGNSVSASPCNADEQ